MSEIEFDSTDLENLATKLDSASGDLDDRDRAMLLAVFKIAGDQVVEQTTAAAGAAPEQSPTFRVSVPESLPPLSEGFVNSFTPGREAGFENPAAVEWDVSGTIMGGMPTMVDEIEDEIDVIADGSERGGFE